MRAVPCCVAGRQPGYCGKHNSGRLLPLQLGGFRRHPLLQLRKQLRPVAQQEQQLKPDEQRRQRQRLQAGRKVRRTARCQGVATEPDCRRRASWSQKKPTCTRLSSSAGFLPSRMA